MGLVNHPTCCVRTLISPTPLPRRFCITWRYSCRKCSSCRTLSLSTGANANLQRMTLHRSSKTKTTSLDPIPNDLLLILDFGKHRVFPGLFVHWSDSRQIHTFCSPVSPGRVYSRGVQYPVLVCPPSQIQLSRRKLLNV